MTSHRCNIHVKYYVIFTKHVGMIFCSSLHHLLHHHSIQMVTGLEGSIMECHPEGLLLPKAAGTGNNDPECACYRYYTFDLVWMSEFIPKLLVSVAAMMSTATYGYRACAKYCCPVMMT